MVVIPKVICIKNKNVPNWAAWDSLLTAHAVASNTTYTHAPEIKAVNPNS